MALGTQISVCEKDCVELWFAGFALFFLLTFFFFFDAGVVSKEAGVVSNVVDSLPSVAFVDDFSKFVVESLTMSFDG